MYGLFSSMGICGFALHKETKTGSGIYVAVPMGTRAAFLKYNY